MLKYSVERKLVNIFTVIIISYWVIFGVFIFNNYIQGKYIYPLGYKDEIITIADKYGLNRALIFAIIKTESDFKKDAVSSKNAKGLMQITDSTAKYIADMLGVEEYDIFNVETNINFGCFYVKYLSEKFEDGKTAIVAYNAGEGNVKEWLKNNKYSEDGKTLKNIPFSESREYLKKVEKSLNNYNKLYKNILDK